MNRARVLTTGSPCKQMFLILCGYIIAVSCARKLDAVSAVKEGVNEINRAMQGHSAKTQSTVARR